MTKSHALVLSSKVQSAVPYRQLLSRVRSILLKGRKQAEQVINQISVRTFWEVGRWINCYIEEERLKPSGIAPYGEKVISHLADDLHYDSSVLYRSLKLARSYQTLEHVPKLLWTHHFDLLSISDEELREQLTRSALKEKWSTYRTRKEIRQAQRGLKNSSVRPIYEKRKSKKLRTKKGKLHYYQVVEKNGRLFLDLGFRNLLEIPPSLKNKFKLGDIVEGEKLEQCVRRPEAAKADLFTYKAFITGIPDADTYWILVHLGFGRWHEDKLRLRGIDCPEIATPAGKAAKVFVEKWLAGVPEVLITTTRTDKYDRFLTDFYVQKNGIEIYLNQILVNFGHAILF